MVFDHCWVEKVSGVARVYRGVSCGLFIAFSDSALSNTFGGSESHAFLRLGKVLGVVRCTSDTVCATALTVSSRFAIFFFAVVLGSLPYNQGARIRACRMMVSRRFGRLFAWVANLTVKNHQVTRVSSFNYGINKGFGSVNISELSRGTARL